MMRGFVFLLLLCLGINASAQAPYQSESETDLGQFRYVFITGFLNEALFGYYDDNKKVLTDLGVKPSDIQFINMPTSGSVGENSKKLAEELFELNKYKRKPLVIFAHSKGAVEFLRFATDYSDYIESRVYKIILIQGAFGGCHIADYINGEGIPVDSKMDFRKATEFKSQVYLQKVLKIYTGDGLNSLVTSEARKFRSNLRADILRLPQSFNEKIWFVTSTGSEDEASWLISATTNYLDTYYGPNDGLLLTRDQIIQDVGAKKWKYKADHLDLVISAPYSNQDFSFRRAFMYDVLSEL